jgi:hypothetical protein
MQEIKSNSPTNVAYYAHSKSSISHHPLQKTTFSTSRLIPFTAPSVERNLIKENRSSSALSSKKSVKFIEKPEDFELMASMGQAGRPRSNSILKCRSLSKNSNKTKFQNQHQQKHLIPVDFKNQ